VFAAAVEENDDLLHRVPDPTTFFFFVTLKSRVE